MFASLNACGQSDQEESKNSNTFNDHEKSIFADAIASFYEGQGTEASVVKTIRDYGSQNAG